MARQLGAHVEYSTLNADGERIERVFSSELNALRSAVENGNRAVFIQYGETIQEAIAREAEEKATAKPPTPPAGPSPRGSAPTGRGRNSESRSIDTIAQNPSVDDGEG